MLLILLQSAGSAASLAGAAASSSTATGSLSVIAAPLWTPVYLGAKLTNWYDAQDSSTFTLASTNVVEWRDKSGNGRHLNTDISHPDRPHFGATVFNGLPGVNYENSKFQETNQLQGISGEYSVTFFMAHSWSTTGAQYGRMWTHGAAAQGDAFSYLRGSTATNGYLSLEGGTETSFYEGWTSTAKISSGGKFASTPPDYRLWHDGSLRNKTSEGSDGTQNTTNTTLKINAAGDYSQRNDQRIGEMVFAFGYALSDNERERVEGYMAHRWGLANALPAGHPYKTAAPTVNALQGSALVHATASADLTVSANGAAVNLAGAMQAHSELIGSLSLSIGVSGSALSVVTASAAPSVANALAANASALVSATGAVALVVPLSGAASSLVSGSAGLTVTTGAALSGAAQVVATASAALSLAVPLQGAAVAVESANAALSIVVALSGSALCVASVGGSVAVSKPLAGAGSAISTGTGDLGVSSGQALGGAAVATVSAVGALGVVKTLAAAPQAVSQGIGSLSVGVVLAGQASAIASADAPLALSKPLAGQAAAVVTATPSLLVVSGLSGQALVASSATGALAKTVALSGDVAAVVTMTGAATRSVLLSGAVQSVVTASAGFIVPIFAGPITVSTSVESLALGVSVESITMQVTPLAITDLPMAA